jgi:membrane associated rhomboid family serine protease
MIYLKCECGSGIGVPSSFTGEPVLCEDCGRMLRLLAGAELTDADASRWRLELTSGPPGTALGEQILLAGAAPISIGKAEGNHLLLAGDLVSRAHARLFPTEHGWTIQDTSSRNGVYVNTLRVGAKPLERDDLVCIGPYVFRYGPAGPNEIVKPALPLPIPAMPADDFEDVGVEYDLAQPPPPPPVAPQYAPPSAVTSAPHIQVASLAPGPPCPSCRKTLPFNARICVDCGIDIRTGRPLITAQGVDEDTLHVRAENTIRVLSWIIPFGLYPIASEARGHSRPYAIWSIFGLTVLASFMFFMFTLAAPEPELAMGTDLMLWAGDSQVTKQRAEQVLQQVHESHNISGEEEQELAELLESQQASMEFRPHQLFTHALLHNDILHLAGNMIFLLVLGTRVNALIGNLKTAIVYPLLAVAGGVGHLLSTRGEPAAPMLGASGAVMGLAGMYLVLFPLYRIHMTIWLRLGLFTGFRLLFKIFALRGFLVVLFFIAFDVLATLLKSPDHVAHWAHLGGFITGALVALVLLFTRMTDAHGGDIVSVTLGKRAWTLLGKPAVRAATSTAATPSN